jgi:predicted nuclease of restriction endonuclease-like RecB superfamily
MQSVLPSNLLIARSRSGKIKPVYAPLEERYVELASRLIETYEAHVGKRQGELVKHCRQFEGDGFDYRLVRGLLALLNRSAVFEPQSHIAPQKARREVFTEANRYALVATNEMKKEVMAQAASRLGISPLQLEESLWSDAEDELVLERFVPLRPRELIQQYNLSLTQTLLFKAVSLEFTAGGNYQRIFRRLKYLGLMYTVEQVGGIYRVFVDGPVSLFKMTERYGTSLAKLLPSILEAREWRLKAHILAGERQAPKLVELELDSDKVKEFLNAPAAEETRERFDSSVEAAFARSFNALKLGWILKREPELLTAGRYVFIPDFGFEKNGVKAYLEVVGFWTDEYLQKKLGKLRELDVENLLIAVDRNLSCAKFKEVKGLVIFFDKKVPLKPVVDYLKQLEEKIDVQQAETIDGTRLGLTGDVIDVTQLADEQSVSVGALVRWLQANPGAQYRLIGTLLISEQKLRVIAERLEALEGSALPAALGAIEEEGFSSPEKVLEALGYVVKWRGLDPDSATIRKQPGVPL